MRESVADAEIECRRARRSLRHPRPRPPRLSNCLRSDREPIQIERESAVLFEHLAVDHDPSRAAGFAHGEGRNNNIGKTTIFFEGGGMAHERDGLALDLADASRMVAAERICRCGCGDVATVAVRKQPVLGAVVFPRGRWKRETVPLISKRNGPTLAVNENIGPRADRRQSE